MSCKKYFIEQKALFVFYSNCLNIHSGCKNQKWPIASIQPAWWHLKRLHGNRGEKLWVIINILHRSEGLFLIWILILFVVMRMFSMAFAIAFALPLRLLSNNLLSCLLLMNPSSTKHEGILFFDSSSYSCSLLTNVPARIRRLVKPSLCSCFIIWLPR